jgi:hypothetical protein
MGRLVKPEGHKTSGRLRSRANALKHGLSARVFGMDESDRLKQLIALLAPDCEDKELWHAARRTAEAWLYCERVSRARSDVIAARTGRAHDLERYSPQGSTDPLTRFERRAMRQLEAALEILQLLLHSGV